MDRENNGMKNVYLYLEDYKRLEHWVLLHPDIETGGNLFGLWTPRGDLVLHVVVGPGMNCKRTMTSFNQDEDYMEKVGQVLTRDYMLCHVGEWHSHHQLRLTEPSEGDVRTVWNNLPKTFSFFLLMIATIASSGSHPVLLHPYFFIQAERKRYIVPGRLIPLKESNPFLNFREITDVLEEGEEITSEKAIQQVALSDTPPVSSKASPLQRDDDNAGFPMDFENENREQNELSPKEAVASLNDPLLNQDGLSSYVQLQTFKTETQPSDQEQRPTPIRGDDGGGTDILVETATGTSEPNDDNGIFSEQPNINGDRNTSKQALLPSRSVILVELTTETVYNNLSIQHGGGYARASGRATSPKPEVIVVAARGGEDLVGALQSPSAQTMIEGKLSTDKTPTFPENGDQDVPVKERPQSPCWFNTKEGENVLESIEKEIISWLKDVGTGVEQTRSESDAIIFYFKHKRSDWTLTLPKNFPKERAWFSDDHEKKFYCQIKQNSSLQIDLTKCIMKEFQNIHKCPDCPLLLYK